MIPDDRHPLARLLADLTAERYTRTPPPQPAQQPPDPDALNTELAWALNPTQAELEAARNRAILRANITEYEKTETPPDASSHRTLRIVGDDT